MLTRGAQVTGVAVCCLCLTWISVSLRFYVRLRIQKFVGREDWLTFAAMILFTTLCALFLRATDFGLGAHMDAIPSDWLQIGFKYIFVSELLYVLTTAVVKLSIGVYFLRLSSKPYHFRVIYATLAVVMVFSTMYFFFLLFQCSPISYIWAQYGDGKGSCLSGTVLANVTYAHAAMSALTDWSLGILPVFFVRKLTLDPRTKISVILILSLGFFASSATIVRIVYIRQLQVNSDYSWFGINLVKWSMVEPAIGITAAAIATLRPLFTNFLAYSHQRFSKDSDNETNYTVPDSERGPAESRTSLRHRESGQEYSEEFADMLGLKRLGVTTTVSAAKPSTKWQRRKSVRSELNMNVAESQTELWDMKSDEVPDWNIGIKREMTVTVD